MTPFGGSYNTVCTAAPGNPHSAFDEFGQQTSFTLNVQISGSLLSLSGSAAFGSKTGNLNNGQFTASGVNTVAGFQNVSTYSMGQFQANGVNTIEFAEHRGWNMELPGGQPSSYNCLGTQF